MMIRRSVWIGGIGLLVAGALARGGLDAAAWWEATQLRQRRLAIKLSRLHGWIAAAPEVTRRADAVFGPADPAHVTMVTLHQQAAAAGVRMTEMRPQAGQVELLVEGTAPAVGAYISGLAGQRPPVRLAMVSVAIQSKVEAPLTARVRVIPVSREP